MTRSVLWLRPAALVPVISAAFAGLMPPSAAAHADPAATPPAIVAPAERAPSMLTPPQAARIPHRREIHERTDIDEYFWLRERDNPKVMEHLKAELAYTDARTAHLSPLVDSVYAEMLSRLQQTDLSVPYRDNGFFYYVRTEEGKAYPIFCRRPAPNDGSMIDAGTAPEQILLDVNILAKDKPTLFVRPLGVSPDNTILAYGEDPTGGRIITIRFKNLKTGALLPDVIENASGDFEWFDDNRTFVYATLDHALRSAKVLRSTLGAGTVAPELILDETDERFDVGVSRTLSGRYVAITSSSMTTSEWRMIRADSPDAKPIIITPRRDGIEYSVTHHAESDRFFILHNHNALNFTLSEAPAANPVISNWKTVIPERSDAYLTGVTAFRDFLLIESRENGVPALRVRRFDTNDDRRIDFTEDSYTVDAGPNAEYATNVLRFSYSSFTTPPSVFDENVVSHQRTLLKEQPVPGGYDRTKYTSKRYYAKAPDGAEVPVALVFRTDLHRPDAPAPTLLYSYGSYGFSTDVRFNTGIFSLLDRGMVFAIAQIRGGSEKGRAWYEQGRMMNKRNTFTDFIAAAEFLIANNFTTPAQLAIRGGSAGGLLMGAVTNMRPDLFRAVVADVPFVDVINTMLDDDLPLTVAEFEQWGNPRDKPAFDYMISYSPYDNVAPKPYPAVLATTGFFDSQVSYWEPAKWVQRLRDNTTSDPTSRPILLKINLEAAHGGASGRYERMEEDAFRYAWVLDQLGIKK
jgi:oligopeptidase B